MAEVTRQEMDAQINASISNQGLFTKAVLNKFIAVINRINGHIAARGNPHNLQPSDIGLGNVANYRPATKKRAQEGFNNTTYMTPKRTDDYNRVHIYGPLAKLFNDAADRL
ncbi:tail protein [Pseudomonas phage vB_Pae10145-KEN51]|uniref:Uncharacterized protein n=6 Tax=root TaxID=1 RepID=A0AAE7V821_9CAUD|nr:hypothetical protein [Pseudomonas aeruginosa]YP_009619752.1 tail protein [Pseudomonas phage SL2]ANM44925.1 structural protein [Pseudomonas phage KTN4]QGK90160.1 hypothetical protein [Pseudomonas phage vB_PA32_GUMS]QJB22803.1 hypothetical protein fnug_160 [Pseudomonas phage fnug]QOV08015.1 putative structural protein [Pseudomonas phage vB_PaeM_kmuB]QXN68555.1 hypothetical protein [Pseudomonas phage PA7]QYV98899.1 hypothetical protein [Pseudomonas phage T2P]QYV99323.1 hypothetical protein 